MIWTRYRKLIKMLPVSQVDLRECIENLTAVGSSAKSTRGRISFNGWEEFSESFPRMRACTISPCRGNLIFGQRSREYRRLSHSTAILKYTYTPSPTHGRNILRYMTCFSTRETEISQFALVVRVHGPFQLWSTRVWWNANFYAPRIRSDGT